MTQKVTVALAVQTLQDAGEDVQNAHKAYLEAVRVRDNLIREADGFLTKTIIAKTTRLSRQRVIAIVNTLPEA